MCMKAISIVAIVFVCLFFESVQSLGGKGWKHPIGFFNIQKVFCYIYHNILWRVAPL